MTEQPRSVDLSIDAASLGLIMENLIVSIANKIQKVDSAIPEKNMLFQLFLADLRSSQLLEAQQKAKAEEEKKE